MDSDDLIKLQKGGQPYHVLPTATTAICPSCLSRIYACDSDEYGEPIFDGLCPRCMEKRLAAKPMKKKELNQYIRTAANKIDEYMKARKQKK